MRKTPFAMSQLASSFKTNEIWSAQVSDRCAGSSACEMIQEKRALRKRLIARHLPNVTKTCCKVKGLKCKTLVAAARNSKAAHASATSLAQAKKHFLARVTASSRAHDYTRPQVQHRSSAGLTAASRREHAALKKIQGRSKKIVPYNTKLHVEQDQRPVAMFPGKRVTCTC